MNAEAANDPSAHPFAHGTSKEDFDRLRAEGNMLSDGPVDMKTFERGWALNNFNVAHYWRRLRFIDVPRPGAIYKPICSDDPARVFIHCERLPLMRPGNWTRCAHCSRIAEKRKLK